MASGGSLNNLSTDLLTPLWKTTPEFKDENDSPPEAVNRNDKTTGYGVRLRLVVHQLFAKRLLKCAFRVVALAV